ncbi:MAG: type II toxin-antitoxin system RelE/ParE family toxin [Pseudonocardiales bacterium]|nr:MAG: type II toxin-antitoxin system RelE/ParE family toxin [Pseudonocardiales bacterium]
MSRYRVEVTRDALRASAKLDKPVRRRVQAAIDGLGENPRPSGVIALRGLRGAYCLRVGNYRVIYTVDDNRLVVLVVDLGHRREIYRDL